MRYLFYIRNILFLLIYLLFGSYQPKNFMNENNMKKVCANKQGWSSNQKVVTVKEYIFIGHSSMCYTLN